MGEAESKVTIIYGQEKKQIEVSEKEYSCYFAHSEDVLWNCIEEHKWISFDLFDTLLMRKVLLPEDVFELVELRAKKIGIEIRDFAQKRIDAQSSLGLTNPDIYKIYDKLAEEYDISEEAARSCMELEMQLEEEVLIPREDMARIFHRCIDAGKHVSIVTDMYLSKTFIETLLEKNGLTGYENLYVSCNSRQLKLQGLLGTYKNETSGQDRDYLHIGDNWINDGVCAKQAGIDCVLLHSGYAQVNATELKKAVELSKTVEEHVMLGLITARICNSPFAVKAGKLILDSDYNYGYTFCAPLINYFVLWLSDEIVEGKFDNILFAARDGFLVQKMYQYYKEKRNLNLPEGIYFYTSRKAAVMTILDNEAAINMVINISRGQKPEKIMRDCFGLSEDKILPYDDGDIHKYVWKHKEAILERSFAAKMNYFKYVAKCGLKIGKKYAFMDFVSSGTSQKALRKSMPFELHGLYAGWNGTENQKDYNVRSLFSGSRSYFMQAYKRMETFLTSKEPSLFCIDENGNPVFESSNRSEKELEYVENMQRACLDFQKDMLDIIDADYKNIEMDFVDVIFSAAKNVKLSDEASVLNSLVLVDDWNGKQNFIQNTVNMVNETVQDNRIGEIIDTNSDLDYTDILKDADWETFLQFSVMREGLLNWYPFKKNTEILHISNGYGAITGLLARKAGKLTVVDDSDYRAEYIRKRYKSVGNVEVVSQRSTALNNTYDYVIIEQIINTKQELREILSLMGSCLKKDGRMIFVCSNKLGVKNLCGAPDLVTGRPFDSLKENECERLSRSSLIQELEQNSQVKGMRLYYPFPDHNFPQAIYTDLYMPKASIRDRVISYYNESERAGLVYLENDIYDDLIANNVLQVFANSFLVECSREEIEPEVRFAALSTDRGKEHGFATVICEDKKVRKKILHPNGRKSLELLYENSKYLQQHGVLCVKQELKDDEIEMPCIEQPNLVEHLKQLFDTNPSGVEDIFDLLWENILKSSEHTSFEECELKDKRLNEENAGPILQRAYIDMIPYNCFFQNDKLYFYDQEFVKVNYPAKYVMFRALRYTYIYIKDANKVLPLEQVKKRYELQDVWQCFEEEEARFVEDNRNYDLLSSFYKWAAVGKEEIDANIDRLLSKKEQEKKAAEDTAVVTQSRWSEKRRSHNIDSYKADYRLNELKAVELQLLDEFSRVCKENDLSYCMFYGSLLGTVRHKGFIPWDDDLDVAMPREDYDRLLQIAPNVFAEPYFLQSAESDAGCFYGGYAKLRKSDTAGIEARNEGNICNQGIWIDILPLDVLPENEEERNTQLRKIRYFQRLLMKQSYPHRRMLVDISEQEETQCLEVSKMFSRKELCDGLHDAMVSYGTNKSDDVAVLARYQGNDEYLRYKAVDFEFLIKGVFEGREVPIPVGYENVMKNDYGDEYYLYPEISERKPHHDALFDVKKSYIDYMQ